MSYKHLSIIEREKILFCIAAKYSITATAEYIGRNKATVSRELKRNGILQKFKKIIRACLKTKNVVK